MTPLNPRTPVRVIRPDHLAGRTGVVSEASVVMGNLVVVEMDELVDDDITGVKVFMSEELEEMEEKENV